MDMNNLLKKVPLIEDIANCKEIFWVNPSVDAKLPHAGALGSVAEAKADPAESVDIDAAEARLLRFAPFIAKMFPDAKDGIIESELKEISRMKELLVGGEVKGRLFLKCDSHLPVSGSIKARGGIYEVLKLAEKIAMEEGGLTYDDDYSVLAEPKFKDIFSKYKVAVGSTGNLGLSIGIISATIGFEVTVHMSADARQWKKDMLRAKGAKVVEYPDDYEAAVAQGRREAAEDPACHFVDDENSLDLFEGYSVAGKRLKKHLDDQGITIDKDRRLYVYLPCGVGGAPGGVAWGIKKYFGENAYCFFAEPTHAPCMVLGLVSGLKNKIAVGDIGIDGKTEADGLAVGRPSALVSEIMDSRLTGCFTVDDEKLYPYLAELKDSEDIFIEP
ncbi:MAG: D-serine ammonia-lyase, partial [Firmicutes bacterium]|nr:D-serine ammonia-lyase [Bacillota bacterium]